MSLTLGWISNNYLSAESNWIQLNFNRYTYSLLQQNKNMALINFDHTGLFKCKK